jgi:mycothiol synthase
MQVCRPRPRAAVAFRRRGPLAMPVRVLIVPSGEVDPAALARLCERALTHDPGAGRLPALIARRDHVGLVALDEADRATPIGLILVSGHGEDGFVDLLAVDPAHRRKEVGSNLLWDGHYALSEELGCTVVRTTGHAPFYAWPGVDVRYTAALGFFEAHGYRRTGEAVNMVGSTDVADASWTVAEGLEIHRAGEQDAEELVRAVRETWTEDDWSADLAAAFSVPGAGVFLAREEGEIVGFIAYGVTGPDVGGPVGVWPQARGRDVGLALVRRLIVELREQGHRTGELAWVGPVTYFSKHIGAVISRVFWIYEKRLDD